MEAVATAVGALVDRSKGGRSGLEKEDGDGQSRDQRMSRYIKGSGRGVEMVQKSSMCGKEERNEM